MKIAIACCGLGHVHRGIEVWAKDLAAALYAKGVDLTLFKGGGVADLPYEVVIPCVQRDSRMARTLTGWKFPGAWRTRFATPYKMESITFAHNIIPSLKNNFDIVHMQDPVLADVLLNAKNDGRIKPEVVLANGTEEPLESLARFDYLQELDSYGLNHLREAGYSAKGWFSIPNFVDTDVFRPGDRVEARRRLGLPEDSYIVLSVGAIQRHLKRMDYVISEFGAFSRTFNGESLLVLAGARTDESEELEAMAKELIGDNFIIKENISHEEMPLLYQSADIFTFCLLHGIYGIALAEAAATGLPCVVHDWERVKWVAGPEAIVSDLTQEGALAKALQKLTDHGLRENISGPTRVWADEELSVKSVVGQYVNMYKSICERVARGCEDEARSGGAKARG